MERDKSLEMKERVMASWASPSARLLGRVIYAGVVLTRRQPGFAHARSTSCYVVASLTGRPWSIRNAIQPCAPAPDALQLPVAACVATVSTRNFQRVFRSHTNYGVDMARQRHSGLIPTDLFEHRIFVLLCPLLVSFEEPPIAHLTGKFFKHSVEVIRLEKSHASATYAEVTSLLAISTTAVCGQRFITLR
jgi:hypothetical protein